MATPADVIKHLRTAEGQWRHRPERAVTLIDSAEVALSKSGDLDRNFETENLKKKIHTLLAAIGAFNEPEFGQDLVLQALQGELRSYLVR